MGYLKMHSFWKNYIDHLSEYGDSGGSGIGLLGSKEIENELSEGSAPCSFIKKHGLIPFGISVGGNCILFHVTTGFIYWADHTSFDDDMVSFEDKETGEWIDLNRSKENDFKALVLLSKKPDTFLKKLIDGQLQSELDALD